MPNFLMQSLLNLIRSRSPSLLGTSLNPPELYQIAGRLKAMKKPRSGVLGDLDRRVVNALSDLIAIPLHKVFSAVFKSCQWPDQWKNETVTIIPKNSAHVSLSETRNIACTPLFSKLLESFLLERIRTQVPLGRVQFGVIKGMGVDHFLVETWDEILRACNKGGKAINLMSVDFPKAFNRMDHSWCLRRLSDKGLHPHLVQLTAAFLYSRTMVVKVGRERSTRRVVNGGAPQGSILGLYLFCATCEILSDEAASVALPDTGSSRTVYGNPEEDSSGEGLDVSVPLSNGSSSGEEWAEVDRAFNFFRGRRANPLDDTVLSEAPQYEREIDGVSPAGRPSIRAYVDDFNVVEVLETAEGKRHCTTGKTTVKIHAAKSEKILNHLDRTAGEMNMIVNPNKTQMPCIDLNQNQDTKTFVRASGTEIKSSDCLKILGFVFNKKPSC